MRFLIAVFLIAGLVFASAASAAPWTQVDSFGGVGPDEFRAPQGMSVDAAGNLYVVEQDTHRVKKLDPTGAFIKAWGGVGSGDGELWYPYDVAVDVGGGGVYVTDNSNLRVEKFDTSGKFVSAWGWGVSDGSASYQVCTTGCRAGIKGNGTGQFNSPIGIATDGTHVYVADYSNKRIQKYDLSGTPAGEWTMPGGQTPERLTVAGGKVYVTTRSHTIWRFDTSGVPDPTWDGDGVTGSSGSGAGQLSWPEGITVDGTGVYVADSANNRVSKFDLSGTFKAAWGTRGEADGEFYSPQGVLATGGSLWVADSYNHRLQKFAPTGVHQLTVGKPLGKGDFYFPRDVAVTPSGEIYVASDRSIQRLDGSGTPIVRWTLDPSYAWSVTPTASGVYATVWGDHVNQYDPNGNLVNQFGDTGSGPGQLNYPAGGAVDTDGNLYIADRVNHRIDKFGPAGASLAAFGSYGSGNGNLDTPRDVALDSAGNVYVADGGNHRVVKFSPAGDFLAKWGGLGSGDGQFRDPQGVAVDAEGHVFVSDRLNNRIQEFDSNGQFVAKWGTFGGGPGELARPNGLSVDSAGALWVADEDNHRIVRFCCPAGPPAPAPGGGGEPPAPGGGPGTADTTAPRIVLSGRRLQRTLVARRRGLALRVQTSERATVALRAVVAKRTARRLRLRGISIGRASASLAGPGTSPLRLRLSARARRALLRAPRVRIVIRASAADPAGNRSSASLAITARR